MLSFVDRLANLFDESVIDKPQRSLVPQVFDAQHHIRSSVRSHILKVWNIISTVSSCKRVVLVGGAASYNYSDDSDIDVLLEIPDASTERAEMCKKLARRHSGAVLIGTHEINYVSTQQMNLDFYDSVYDVLQQQWLKGPTTTILDIKKYLTAFNAIIKTIDYSTAELVQDLADFRALKHASQSDSQYIRTEVAEQLDAIDADLETLSQQHTQLHAMRQSAFDSQNVDRIRDYGSRNKLPENVIYLLLRRHCYIHLLDALYKASHEQPAAKIVDAEEAIDEFDLRSGESTE